MITNGNTDLQHYLNTELTNQELLKALSGEALFISANGKWCKITASGLLKADGLTFVPRTNMMTGHTFDPANGIHKNSMRSRIALNGISAQGDLEAAVKKTPAPEPEAQPAQPADPIAKAPHPADKY